MITLEITTTEYLDLAGKCAAFEEKINAFARYVNSTDFSVDRKVCGAILGFEVEDVSDKS